MGPLYVWDTVNLRVTATIKPTPTNGSVTWLNVLWSVTSTLD